MTILSLTSFLSWLCIRIMLKLKCTCLTFCSPCHSIILFNFKCFIFYIVHQVEPPSSFNFQVDSVHLWPTFKSNGDTPFSLFPWWDRLYPMMLFGMPSPPSWEMWGFIYHMNKLMSFHYFPFNLFVSGLTSCYQLMASTPSQMLSLFITPKQNLVSLIVSFPEMAIMVAI